MEISTSHHQQVMSSHSLEEVLGGCHKTQEQQQQQQHQERKPRPQPEQALRCPRCNSTNTKFCYYNNYSLTQPRYFCKGCRRYWTQGGSLRNVPVGGGCRKNKRPSSSSSKKPPQDQAPFMPTTNANPNPLLTLPYDPCDFSLAFARFHTRQLGLDGNQLHDPFLLSNPNPNPNPNAALISTPPAGSGFLDILKSGFLDSTTTTTTVTNPNGCHNFYYGYNGSVEEMENGVGGEEVMLPVDGSQVSSCKAMDGGEGSKVQMGLQWQLGGHGSMGVDSGREYWDGVGSSWHGLINM